jgi:hypothetical protein
MPASSFVWTRGGLFVVISDDLAINHFSARSKVDSGLRLNSTVPQGTAQAHPATSDAPATTTTFVNGIYKK